LVTWSEGTLKTYCKAAFAKHSPVATAGLWADAVHRRAPVVCNDYAAAEGQKGLPDGHPELRRLISVPVLESGKVVLLAGVGNKTEPYNDLDVETVQLISNAVWRMVQKQRTMRQLQGLSLAVEQSGESIIITDTEARIEYVNQAFVRETGYSLAEARGQNSRILQSGKTPRESFDALWEALRQGRSWKGEFCNRRKDGTELYEVATISPVQQRDGRVTHYVAVKQDITQRKETEHALEAAKQAAEAASRAKSEFLANMSHEIRTPLTAIIGFSESLLVGDMDRRGHAEAVRAVIDNGRHLRALIDDILDLSKIEAERLDVEILPVDLAKLLRDLAAGVGAQAQAKGLDFDLHLLPPLPRRIYSDPTRLRQILDNLSSNAIKFTEQGSVRLLVSCDVQARRLQCSVLDTGIGISAEQLPRLFRPFGQADASVTRRFGGTGLGLAISRRLVRLLGGDIQVRSEPGSGSLFVVEVDTGPLAPEDLLWALPALAHSPVPSLAPEQEEQEQEQEQEQAQVPAVSGRILLAEDNPYNQRLIGLYIERTGAQIAIAENGEQAVEQALGGQFDLVLMDLQMPVMGGLEATRLLRDTLYPGPIVALTAHSMSGDREQALAAGCTDFLTKPVDWAALYRVIAAHLPAAPDPSALPCTVGDPALATLTEGFRAGLPATLEQLASAAAAGDWEQVRRQAHQLKGVAGSLGYPGLTRTAGELEHRIRCCSQAPDELDRLLRLGRGILTDGNGDAALPAAAAVPAGSSTL
jgi:two-component system, sensor histidine kinase and response regulator